MVKFSVCGKEIVEKPSTSITMDNKTYNFCNKKCLSDFHPLRRLTQRKLSRVVLNKTSAELLAIGTGLLGIIYALQDTVFRALVMDALSVIAGIAAFVVGIEHLRYLKEHDLLRRGALLIGVGIMIAIAILVCHFGFR